MPIVIKEIRVSTIVEKKIIQPPDVSAELLSKIKDEVVAELKHVSEESLTSKRKNDR